MDPQIEDLTTDMESLVNEASRHASQKARLPYGSETYSETALSIPLLSHQMHYPDNKSDLNDFLLSLDPFRYTFPSLETEKGGIKNNLRIDSVAEANVRNIVLKVAALYGFAVKDIEFNQYSSILDPTGPRDHPLITIEVEMSAMPMSGDEVVKILHTRLRHLDIRSPYVELICYERNWFLTIRPILHNQTGREARISWEKVRLEVLQILESQLSSEEAQWSNVCVFLCTSRTHRNLQLPTILVSMIYPAKSDWSRTLMAIKDVLFAKKVINLEVEFVYGISRFSTPDREDDEVTVTNAKYLDVEALSGNSIGVDGIKGSGSIGGCILLADSRYERPRVCLLTCHHVVQTREWKDDLEKFKRPLPLQGKESLHSDMTKMRSPSMEDHHATSDFLQSCLEQSIRIRDHMLSKNDNSEDFHAPFMQRKFERNTNRIPRAIKAIETLDVIKKPIGRVIASSGIQVREFDEPHGRVKRRLDWAIVEIEDESRFACVSAPNALYVSSAICDQPPGGKYEPSDDETTETAILEKGQWVCMRGRTSGYTTGRVNAIAMENCKAEFDVGPFQELIVCATSETHRMMQFSNARDSGAFIFDQRGRVVGMQVAQRFPAEQNKAHHTGIIPIDTLFEDIKRQTGAIPRLPSSQDIQDYRIGL